MQNYNIFMKRRTIIGAIFIAAGALKMASSWDLISPYWLEDNPVLVFIVPALLLYVGFELIASSCDYHQNRWLRRPYPMCDVGKRIRCSVHLGGDEYVCGNQQFHGAELYACMGGIRLDLRQAVISDDEEIDIRTFIGGVELLLPTSVQVEVHSRSFIGGVSNDTIAPEDRATPCLHITASNIIGGVSISNEA